MKIKSFEFNLRELAGSMDHATFGTFQRMRLRFWRWNILKSLSETSLALKVQRRRWMAVSYWCFTWSPWYQRSHTITGLSLWNYL